MRSRTLAFGFLSSLVMMRRIHVVTSANFSAELNVITVSCSSLVKCGDIRSVSSGRLVLTILERPAADGNGTLSDRQHLLLGRVLDELEAPAEEHLLRGRALAVLADLLRGDRLGGRVDGQDLHLDAVAPAGPRLADLD